jgi:ATP-dependent Clp protease adaptor protein ClpS
MLGTEVLPVTGVETGVDSDLEVPWQVLIYNDPVNLMSYVAMVIRRVFGYTEQRSEQLMLDVHHKGKAVVWSGVRERAELFVHQLQGYQLLAAMQKAGD